MGIFGIDPAMAAHAMGVIDVQARAQVAVEGLHLGEGERIVDPKRVRSFAQSAGRFAKNDTIDAEMIAWFAETLIQAASSNSASMGIQRLPLSNKWQQAMRRPSPGRVLIKPGGPPLTVSEADFLQRITRRYTARGYKGSLITVTPVTS